MYQSVYETAHPTFSAAILHNVTKDLQAMHFLPESASPTTALYRDGDRYIEFLLDEDCLTVRLGVGSHDPGESLINSMLLNEMIGFLYGGMQRGCHAVDEKGLDVCLQAAMQDLKEFAHEFLRGDFRPFLRVLAIKKREEREAAKVEAEKKIYLA